MTNKEIIAELTRRIKKFEHRYGWSSCMPSYKISESYYFVEYGRYTMLLEIRNDIEQRHFIGGHANETL